MKNTYHYFNMEFYLNLTKPHIYQNFISDQCTKPYKVLEDSWRKAQKFDPDRPCDHKHCDNSSKLIMLLHILTLTIQLALVGIVLLSLLEDPCYQLHLLLLGNIVTHVKRQFPLGFINNKNGPWRGNYRPYLLLLEFLL